MRREEEEEASEDLVHSSLVDTLRAIEGPSCQYLESGEML